MKPNKPGAAWSYAGAVAHLRDCVCAEPEDEDALAAIEDEVRKLKRQRNLASKKLARIESLPSRLNLCAVGAAFLDQRIADAFVKAKEMVVSALKGKGLSI